MSSITSANAILALSITGVFSAPQQLQQFGTDDIYDTDDVDASEPSMGVDGILTAGYVNVPVMQRFTLQANSPSIALFDQWYWAQKALQDVYHANMTTILKSVGKSFVHNRGFLRNYKPIPDAKKTLQPIKFAILWQSVMPLPI